MRLKMLQVVLSFWNSAERFHFNSSTLVWPATPERTICISKTHNCFHYTLTPFFGTWVLLNVIGIVPNLIILTVCFNLHDVCVLSFMPFENLRDSFRLFIVNLLFFLKLRIFEFRYKNGTYIRNYILYMRIFLYEFLEVGIYDFCHVTVNRIMST
jgi:hypothetical protein